MSEDLYSVLGLQKNASAEEIKKAYRKMSLINHPDRNNGSESSTEKFKAVTHSYEILSDEQKRKQYDMFGLDKDNQLNSQGMSNMDHSDILNFFSKNMFGGMMGMGVPQVFTMHTNMNNDGMPSMPNIFNMNGMGGNMNGGSNNGMFAMNNLNKPVPIIMTEEITLSRAYTDYTLPLEITRWIVENGTKREETETLYVNIPRGIDNNELIILREKGNILNEKNKGDIKIFIKVLNDTDFTRNGLDLNLNKVISLKESLCGFSFDMKYIDGRIFKINNGIGNIITNNYKKVIPNMGMKRETHVGNLIIDFTITFPEKLSEEQISALEKIL